MNPWIEATGWTLIHFVWQGTLLTLATAAALGLCRRSAAAGPLRRSPASAWRRCW